MSTFYEIDPSHVSFKEYWWGNKSPMVLIGWAIKLLRVRIPTSADDPNTESTLPFIVDQLPPEVSSAFSAQSAMLESLGFFDPVYHVIHDPGTRTTVYWATYRHESGNYFARIHQRIWQQTAKPNRGLFVMFFTEFADGTFLVSSSGKPDMEAPATIAMNRMHGAATEALWSRHTALTEARNNGNIVPVLSQADAIAATERHHVLTRDFHLNRRVFRPRNTEEQARAESYATAVQQGLASGVQHPEVFAELEKLQESKPAWRNTIWILVGSLLLFIIVGAANWKITLWLIPVFFIHECGHWIMMRIFKYRNLRMFFIPFFGAGVSGRHWNVAGWKKALVSLAGPLPGIALGFILGVLGIVTHRDMFLQAALMLVLINGYNLLPILPLDGGRFLQAILFCRNQWLDTGFQLVAIAGMLGLAIFGGGKIFMYIGIAMAISLPVTIKLGNVIAKLKKTSLPPPLPGQDRIPPTTADIIASEVKAAIPKNLSNKAAAQHALTVYENLNAHPPNALATIGLLALYGGGIFIAILSGLLFIVAKEGKLSDFARAVARQPVYAYACGNIQSWHGAGALTTNTEPQNVLVATLHNVATARSTFTQLTAQLPSNSRLTLFGQSLLVTLPCSEDAAREKWFDRLQGMDTNAFVAISNQPVTFNLNFIAPTSTEATNLERALRNFLNANVGVRLIPPWSPEAQKPGFAAFDRERWMWRQINVELTRSWTNADFKALDAKITAARKRGSVSEANNLMKERTDAYKNAQAAALEKLKSNPDFDPQLVDLHTQLSDLSYTNRAERATIYHAVGEKLGAEKSREGSSSSGASLFSGFIKRNGLLFELNWLSMDDPATNLPAMTDWLCEQHCAGIRYEFIGSYGVGSDEGDEEE